MTSLYAVSLVGAIAGAIDAVVTDQKTLWPTLLPAASRRVVRPGIVVTMAVGAAAGASVFAAFASPCARVGDVSGNVLALSASVGVAILAVRCLTDESDKRLLHAAVIKACTAPAAHPETVRSLDSASAAAIYAAADRLTPRARAWP